MQELAGFYAHCRASQILNIVPEKSYRHVEIARIPVDDNAVYQDLVGLRREYQCCEQLSGRDFIPFARYPVIDILFSPIVITLRKEDLAVSQEDERKS